MKQEIILIGGGGHCKSCIDVIEMEERYHIAGIVDLPEKLHQRVLGYEIIATDDDLPELAGKYDCFLVTVGQIKSPEPRIALFEKLKGLGLEMPTIVSPLAHVSRHARVGAGSVVMHYACVNAGAVVGDNCIINTMALIEHDAVIGDHCHVSTAAVINGEAKIGRGTFFGSGAVCREGVNIGEGSIVGCGVCVLRDLPPGTVIKTSATPEKKP
jgi:sugar O-acyltransferase (sialic acid O-acetyltransferase NeuD family)